MEIKNSKPNRTIILSSFLLVGAVVLSLAGVTQRLEGYLSNAVGYSKAQSPLMQTVAEENELTCQGFISEASSLGFMGQLTMAGVCIEYDNCNPLYMHPLSLLGLGIVGVGFIAACFKPENKEEEAFWGEWYRKNREG